MAGSLWGESFEIPETPKVVKKVLEKVNHPKDTKVSVTKTIKSNKVSDRDKLVLIRENVNRILGKYGDDTQLIKTREELTKYIDFAINCSEIAIDTETDNSLDPITCKLMGACIYSPGLKNVYIPVNHVDINTRERFDWQLTEADIKEEFDRLTAAKTKVITHHGKFDYEVLKMTTGYVMSVYWDTLVGEKILDENKHEYGLKHLYRDKFDPEQEKYDIEELFEGVEYAIVEPELFALYAATDAYMTYKLYKWQLEQFDIPDHSRIKNLFLSIEMPVLQVSAEMELAGICLDQEYAKRLSAKYAKKLEDIDEKTETEVAKYEDIISQWRLTTDANEHPIKNGKMQRSKSEQLKFPVNLDSPTQLAILLYDVLKCGVVNKKKPRGTGEEELTAIYAKYKIELCNIILERRGLLKLITTYIDKLPQCVNPADGKLHAKFNQLGAGTGRFSSSDPNLQNIPSHEKSIRMLFEASPGCCLCGADFSAQEPRLLTQFSQDSKMLNAYKEGKDLYAIIAQQAFHNGYWDNMEHYEDGSPNPEGKKRRGIAKTLLLGIMYGRGCASIADQIGCSIPEAQKIIDTFFESFPKVRDWVTKTEQDAKKLGYVEDYWGRRRRLPDIMKPKYTITAKGEDTSISKDFNPLLGALGLVKNTQGTLTEKWQNALSKMKGRKEYEQIKLNAAKEGVTIIDNGAFIAQAERQCVNARIQGSAATLTKLAMIEVFHDEELRTLGFKLLLAVHDELIGECPIENVKKAAERLSYVMVNAGVKNNVDTPMKCDAEIEDHWYFNEYKTLIRKEYAKYISAGDSKEVAWSKLCEEHCESTPEQLKIILESEEVA